VTVLVRHRRQDRAVVAALPDRADAAGPDGPETGAVPAWLSSGSDDGATHWDRTPPPHAH
jgi:hypothetical protein